MNAPPVVSYIYLIMSSRKRKTYNCVKHARKRARGRCAKCGKWICSDCAVINKGNLYCADTCATSSVTRPAVTVLSSPPPIKKEMSYKWVVIWALSTIAFGGAVFGTWALRELNSLKQENRSLKENRVKLIEYMRKNNNEIKSLREKLAALSENSEEKTDSVERIVPDLKPQKETRHSFSDNGALLSFNNGAVDKNLVSITFDGGSSANVASDILDTLKSRGVKSTMFLTGQFIRKYPELIVRIAADGHELGNHTFTHPHLTSWEQDRTQALLPNIDRLFISKQLQGNERLLKEKTGLQFSPLWRAPYGEFNRTICRWGLESGYMHVGWRQGKTWAQGLDSNDWIPDENTPGFKTPEQVLEKILTLSETKPYGINGGIILMHLGTERSEKEMQVHLVLGTLIDRLREGGYEIVSVSEMISQSGLNLAQLPLKSDIPVTSIAKKEKNEP